jgi:amino acid permease
MLTNAAWMVMGDNDKYPYNVGLAPTVPTAANLAKSIAGAGVFALPHVFMQMGLVGGAGVIAVFSIMSIYTMSLLLRAK